MSPLPVIVDCDNAMGSAGGDVDDAFALVSLLASPLTLIGIGSTSGNAPGPEVYRNNQALCALFTKSPKLWNSPETVAQLLSIQKPFRFAALGPLTSFAAALRQRPALAGFARELLFVGTNYGIPLPAFSFVDFNQAQDRGAFRAVVHSPVPLTLLPLNVARKLRLTEGQLSGRRGPLADYLRKGSARWFRRSRRLKGVRAIPVWDLGASLYLECPQFFSVRETAMRVGAFGQCLFADRYSRPVKVITGFSERDCWEWFFAKL